MKSEVYYVGLPEHSSLHERSAAAQTLLARMPLEGVIARNDRTAVKIHVGEKNNNTHLDPAVIRVVVERLKALGATPFLTETSTLYKGQRSNAIDHLCHAFAHGFTYEATGAPFIMADGLFGNTEIEVRIPGRLFSSVNIAREVVFADSLVAVSHATGHIEMGLGACLKNLGMGLASRMGKLRQHSSIKPHVDREACTFCMKCLRWCPADAIVEHDGKAFIVNERCIGCGECLAVCRFDAVQYNWGTGSAELQRRVAEHALGAVVDKTDKCLFINFLCDMTRDCDCLNSPQEPLLPDVGIVASLDPVAVDQATLDLTRESAGMSLAEKARPALDASVQLDHAEKIGLGSRGYELIRLGT
jgi:uncharacterized Fe-S center protein